MRPRTAAIGLIALLSGCTGGGAAPPASTPAARPASTAAAQAAAAVTQFDGRYSGESNLSLSRGRDCGPQTGRRTVTVREGQASMLYDTLYNYSASGAVGPDGSVTMISETGRNVRITGRFENGRFQGELNSLQCVRALDLRRAGR